MAFNESSSPTVTHLSPLPPYLMSFKTTKDVDDVKGYLKETDFSFHAVKHGKYLVNVPRYIHPSAVRWQLKKAGLKVWPEVEDCFDKD